MKNDPGSGSIFLSLNQDRDRLQKYWANKDAFCKCLPYSSAWHLSIVFLPGISAWHLSQASQPGILEL